MRKEHLHNKVVHELIARIASGAFPPGERLPAERELCEQMNVSRGTLRKALTALEELGVVEIKPNSGIFVCGISTASLPKQYLPPDFASVNLLDVIEARKAIELAALELACLRNDPESRQLLQENLQAMTENVENISVFLEADLAFHQSLVAASGNSVLVTAFEAIYEYHRFCCIFSSQEEGSEQLALEFHGHILDAFVKGQPKRCKKMLAEHLDSMLIYDQTWNTGRKRLLDGKLSRSDKK